MYFVKKIKKKLKAKRNHVDVAEVQSLADNLREDFLEKEDILKFAESLEMLTDTDRATLVNMTPSSYIGLANLLADIELK